MDFKKITLVLKREYITRARSKSFILSTILTPLVLIAFGALMVWIVSGDTDSEKVVGLVDNTEILAPKLIELDADRYTDVSHLPIDSVKSMVMREEIDAYLVLDEVHIETNENAELTYAGSGGLAFTSSVRGDLRQVIQEERLVRANVTDEIRELFERRPGLDSRKLAEDGTAEDDKAGFMSGVGFVLGLLIFIGLFGYGAMLMRSVIEEKTNRIVEVITSSIKPMELLIGKVIGVCLLGFTQFAIWVVMYIGLSIAAVPIAGALMQDQITEMTSSEEMTQAAAEAGFDPASLEVLSIDPMIFVYFFLFFIFGFFMYAALFAAVGSAVDSEQDTQQFMPILMVPIMGAYFINTRVMVDPDSTLSVVASIFPLTSPINMITRIAVTDVPFWQIGASLIALIATFFGVMWMSAKIYRVGILMYGKKASWGDLLKWIRQS
ncbi:ABC transporter permease [Balneola vulgaris]|jgi:ABC-2 type transport system permease protein|uniref:ABC transporter permease n=1 Tax=Balneola vulgaris TaxID=287535 RepID=UPI00036F815C|nr:ABC transporter permease [Balneola vulgaris]